MTSQYLGSNLSYSGSLGYGSGSGVRQGYTTDYVSTGAPVTYTTGATYATTPAYGTTTYTSSAPVYGATTYTSATPAFGATYVGAPSTTYVAGPSTTYVSAPSTTYVSGATVGGIATHQKVVAEEIPVESRIEYIPFEKKYIEYDRVERIERVPFEREIVEYDEVVHTERIPIERTITDYYAVETQIEYIPKEIEETIVEYEPIERTWERVQYLPVETQIVHYPEREKYVAGQAGKYIQAVAPVTRASRVYQPATTTYQTVQAVAPVTTTYQTVQPVTTYQTVQPTTTTTTYQTVQAVQPTTYQTQVSSSRVAPSVINTQSFVSGAHGTGSNYVYTSGGPLETSTYTSGGYAQPLSSLGYVTKDGTHLSTTGHIVGPSGSQVKANQSYQTSV